MVRSSDWKPREPRDETLKTTPFLIRPLPVFRGNHKNHGNHEKSILVLATRPLESNRSERNFGNCLNSATVKRGFWKGGSCVTFGFLALTFLSSCYLWLLFGHLCSSAVPETNPCCTTQGSNTQPLSTPQRGLRSAEISRNISAKRGNCRKLCFSHPGRQTL